MAQRALVQELLCPEGGHGEVAAAEGRVQQYPAQPAGGTQPQLQVPQTTYRPGGYSK